MRRRAATFVLLVALAAVAALVPPALHAADPGDVATLRWKSKDDAGLYGYLVYRSDRREGPFRRVNRDVVRVVGATDEGIAEYVYVDADVAAGRTYYYYLDTLDRNGRKARFSGVVAKKVAKP